MPEVDAKTARLRRILIIIILATIPIYLLGMVALWVARVSINPVTATPTQNIIYVTATIPPTGTNMPPTRFPTKEPTQTKEPTITPTITETRTPTVTVTQILWPTITDTSIPSPTDTAIPPTDTSTPTP